MKTIKTTNAENKPGTMITIPVFIPDQELDYILSGCFEGGSNYWIKKVEVVGDDYRGKEFASEVISAGGYLTIIESCDGSKPVKHELSKPGLISGLYLYFCKEGSIKFDEMDAGQYDIILQYALFKEVKYA
jgi:hypothetical protein